MVEGKDARKRINKWVIGKSIVGATAAGVGVAYHWYVCLMDPHCCFFRVCCANTLKAMSVLALMRI